MRRCFPGDASFSNAPAHDSLLGTAHQERKAARRLRPRMKSLAWSLSAKNGGRGDRDGAAQERSGTGHQATGVSAQVVKKVKGFVEFVLLDFMPLEVVAWPDEPQFGSGDKALGPENGDNVPDLRGEFGEGRLFGR